MNFSIPAKTIFFGNLLLVVCCAFYLIWWLLAFRPVNPLSGTGWLLLPAAAAGLASVICITQGITALGAKAEVLVPGKVILIGGLTAFIILLAVTSLALHRPVTTELFLIVGWCTMILSEVNALFGSGLFPKNAAVTIMIVILAAAVVSLVCYVLYYKLDAVAGYYAGTAPLLIVACATAAISVCMAAFAK